jgi:hypothetical protein
MFETPQRTEVDEMLLALAALLIQPQIAAQMSFSAEKIALIQPANPATSSNAAFSETSLPLAPVSTDTPVQPAAELVSADLPNAPEPAVVNSAPAIAPLKPSKSMMVSVGELRAEGRRNQRLWIGLGIASHSAATFDAWSTRHAITTAGAQELDPMLKPFAGNASLYAAIQVGPALMDFVGKKMMYSRNSWVRRMWWVPQSASFASSLFCGAHNLGVHPASN